VPELPQEGDDDDTEEEESESESESESDTEVTETSTTDAPAAKSPLLTSHRVSVTSDMDDVSLDGGKHPLSV
jgi:hypothetical protein